MMRTTSEGMGYRFSETNRRISTAGASNIVTRLASRSLTGHELPIHVHQHYGLELHLILNPNSRNDGSAETCMRRRFPFPEAAQEVCSHLENSTLQGLCTCIFDDRRMSYPFKVEHCFARPVRYTLCECDMCTPYTTEELENDRWASKVRQGYEEKQTDVCRCRQIRRHCETMRY
jgi:hypothetical protein